MKRRLTKRERRLAWQFAKVLLGQAWQVLWGAITGRNYVEEEAQTHAATEA